MRRESKVRGGLWHLAETETYLGGITMNIKRLCVAASLTVSIVGLTAVGSADAARCGGRPDGVVVLGDFSTYNSPGEVVSYVATNGLPPGVPGAVVSAVCSGAPG